MAREFPHLLKDDVTLWKRFLASDDNIYASFEYDIRVGEGRDPGPTYERNIRKMALDLSQRRIDAIGRTRDGLTIIEISTSAGLTQIGQLLAYPSLYRQTFGHTGTIFRLLVAQSLQTDIEPVLIAEQIPFLLFPE
jgi:hypothetical protein